MLFKAIEEETHSLQKDTSRIGGSAIIAHNSHGALEMAIDNVRSAFLNQLLQSQINKIKIDCLCPYSPLHNTLEA